MPFRHHVMNASGSSTTKVPDRAFRMVSKSAFGCTMWPVASQRLDVCKRALTSETPQDAQRNDNEQPLAFQEVRVPDPEEHFERKGGRCVQRDVPLGGVRRWVDVLLGLPRDSATLPDAMSAYKNGMHLWHPLLCQLFLQLEAPVQAGETAAHQVVHPELIVLRAQPRLLGHVPVTIRLRRARPMQAAEDGWRAVCQT
jgi:hypothetical protein